MVKVHVHKATGRTLHRGLRALPPHLRAAMLSGKKAFRPRGSAPPQFWLFPLYLSMWLNDQEGDCVSAREAFAKACSGIKISDATLDKFVNANDLANGAELAQVVELMQTQGFAQDNNLYLDGPNNKAVDFSNLDAVRAAIYEAGQAGGCLQAGIAADELPDTAGNIMGWLLPSNSQNDYEDHCVGYCGYGTAQQFVDAINAAYAGTPYLPSPLSLPSVMSPSTTGIALYTWKTIGFVADQAMVNMTGELYIQDPQTVIKGNNPPTSCGVYVYPTLPNPPTPPTPNPVCQIVQELCGWSMRHQLERGTVPTVEEVSRLVEMRARQLGLKITWAMIVQIAAAIIQALPALLIAGFPNPATMAVWTPLVMALIAQIVQIVQS